ncbi:MAG: glycosyltransferase family 4 protein [Bacteroidota bacterium]
MATSRYNDGGIERIVNQLISWFTSNNKGKVIRYNRKALFGKLIFYIKILFNATLRSEAVLFTHLGLAQITTYAPYINYHIMVHGWELEMFSNTKLRSILANADQVICNSKYIEQRLRADFDLTRVTQAYYPIPSLPKIDKALDKTPNPTVLHVGRMSASERYKGHDQLIEAWPKIIDQHPKAQLILVGKGDDKKRLQEKVDSLNMGQQIIFAGSISDLCLSRYYRTSWIFCMPSDGEGQGLVYGEALQFGLPIIALKESPAQEFVRHNKEGILLTQKNSSEIAQAINHLLNHPNILDRYGKAARDRFNWVQQQSEHFWNLIAQLN